MRLWWSILCALTTRVTHDVDVGCYTWPEDNGSGSGLNARDTLVNRVENIQCLLSKGVRYDDPLIVHHQVHTVHSYIFKTISVLDQL